MPIKSRETNPKIYDFPFERVKNQVAGAFRKTGLQGTVADVLTVTGLPKYQVETVLPAVVADCRGQLKVTDSGEILYHFPKGMASQSRKTLWHRFVDWLAKAGTFLFKIWIVVMLIGYFVLFVALIVIALLVSVAVSASRRDDRDSGDGEGLLGLFAVSRIVEFVMLLWMYSGDPVIRTQKKKKPFYKAVFEFVFGAERDPATWGKIERKAVLAWVRKNKGTITLEELIQMTGKSREEANAFVSRLLLEYEGEPMVSDDGTLYYAFPSVMTTSSSEVHDYRLPEQELIPFTRNPSKTNGWIIFFNGFNAVLSLYFLAGSLGGLQARDALSFLYRVVEALGVAGGGTAASVNSGIFWGLGIVPAVYSLLFFGIPALRRWKEAQLNRGIQTNNLRRKVAALTLASPRSIDLAQVQPDSERNAPGKIGPEREALKEALLQDFASPRSVEVTEKAKGGYLFAVPEFERELLDVQKVRQAIDPSKFALGKVVYDSGSD
ncbi:MAG: hypothetical protein HKM06_04195 [Spirochaetales bacterium]|nr:hypothetical protein [Spirochaetales bacterium]